MNAITLHVLAPGLLDRTIQWTREFGSLQRFPALEAILAQSRRDLIRARGMDATLCELFGLTAAAGSDLPLGAVRRYGFGGDKEPGFWLCADPVHFSADVASVYLRGGCSLNISSAEATQLASLFVAHFAKEGWKLEVGSPAHWHMRLPRPIAVRTCPQRSVIGKPVDVHLPTGAEGMRCRALINEVQMLFHGAQINREREIRGAPAINGLWFSGTGTLPSPASLRPLVRTVWSDDPLAIGLGRLASVEVRSAFRSLDTILSGNARGPHLVYLDSMLAPASYDDFVTWRQALEVLETQWFEPIYHGMRNGGLARVHLYDCRGRRFSLRPMHRWRVWRRPKRLDAHAANDDPATDSAT